MNKQEFETAMAPILGRWRRNYNGDQIQLFFIEFGSYAFEDFKKAVEWILKNCRGAPIEPDFKKALDGIRARPVRVISNSNQAAPTQKQEEDFLYRVRDNIWANNTHIFVRGEKPSFILIADEPENEVVKEALAVKPSRIAEIKNHLKQNSYNRFIDKENAPMKTLDFSEFQ